MTIKLCECGCGQPAPIAQKNHSRNGYVKGQPMRFCKGHYLKLRPLRNVRSYPSLEKRFWKYVQKSDGCWIWIGAKSGNGYGTIGDKGKMKGAHRVAWVLANGEIPDGMLIRHKCDNPVCVRADHLELGTVAENSRDMADRGRANKDGPKSPAKGDRNASAKLAKVDVCEIRKLFASGQASMKELANRYGVSSVTIGNIVRRETWKHI